MWRSWQKADTGITWAHRLSGVFWQREDESRDERAERTPLPALRYPFRLGWNRVADGKRARPPEPHTGRQRQAAAGTGDQGLSELPASALDWHGTGKRGQRVNFDRRELLDRATMELWQAMNGLRTSAESNGSDLAYWGSKLKSVTGQYLLHCRMLAEQGRVIPELQPQRGKEVDE